MGTWSAKILPRFDLVSLHYWHGPAVMTYLVMNINQFVIGVYLGAWPALLGASQASVEVPKCLE